MFLSASYKYHNDNEKYTTNYLKCVWSFMPDKYVDDKTGDRERKFKNTCLRRMGMLDTSVIHGSSQYSGKESNSANYQEKLRRISWDRERFASSYEGSDTESDDPEESHESETESSHRASFVPLMREIPGENRRRTPAESCYEASNGCPKDIIPKRHIETGFTETEEIARHECDKS